MNDSSHDITNINKQLPLAQKDTPALLAICGAQAGFHLKTRVLRLARAP